MTRNSSLLIYSFLSTQWKENTIYIGYKPTDPTIRFFWEVIESWGDFERKNLLLYVTGSSRISVLGFRDLFWTGKLGQDPKRFTICLSARIGRHTRDCQVCLMI